jgi:hypothetical protein
MQGAKEFLKEIEQELFSQKNLGLIESVFFPLRFADDRPLDYDHKQIAIELMPKDSRLCKDGQYANSIGTNVQNIVHAMAELYGQEMQADGLAPESLKTRKKGQKGAWRDIYDWLWNYKFTRWLEQNAWSILQKQANTANNWIQFLTEEDKHKRLIGEQRVRRPSPPASVQKQPRNIPVNQPLYLELNLEYPDHQLLLFNSNDEEKLIFCPSLAFAPNSILEKWPISLPQPGSWAEDNEDNEKIFFEKVRHEEFMAILLSKPVNLDWLVPREEDFLPELTAERIKELFEALEKLENYQVFYQSFEVVEAEG